MPKQVKLTLWGPWVRFRWAGVCKVLKQESELYQFLPPHVISVCLLLSIWKIQRHKDWNRWKESFYLLVHTPNTQNNQGWGRLQQGTQNFQTSLQVAGTQTLDPSPTDLEGVQWLKEGARLALELRHHDLCWHTHTPTASLPLSQTPAPNIISRIINFSLK